MEQRKVIDILMTLDAESLKKLIYKLNLDGIVSDEDDCTLSSNMVERWCPECDSYLAQVGYEGGVLNVNSKFFPLHGAVYVLYDTGRHTSNSSLSYMVNHVENYEI